MKKFPKIFLVFIIFVLTLLLSKVVFFAFFAVLFFLVGVALIDTIWDLCQSPEFLSLLRPVIAIVLSAGLAISFYCLLFLPIEFLLTEIMFKVPKISQYISFSVIILMVIFFNLVNWRIFFKTRKSYFIIFLFFFFTGLFYLAYRNEKLSREYLPKIYYYNPKWGIQQVEVKIEGVSFGPVWKRGKVVLDGANMNILDWGENKIIAEIPVPEKFGQVTLSIVREDGKVSNGVPFEIKDPKVLLENIE